MQDSATQWIQWYPCKTKTSQKTQRSLQKFLEPDRKPKVIYSDNSLEFGKACEELTWNHCSSTPHRSETNGIAEGAVRRVKEGTSAVLLQSGLDENWPWNPCLCGTARCAHLQQHPLSVVHILASKLSCLHLMHCGGVCVFLIISMTIHVCAVSSP